MAGASGMESVLAVKAVLHLLVREASLPLGPVTSLIRMGSVFANRAGHYIN